MPFRPLAIVEINNITIQKPSGDDCIMPCLPQPSDYFFFSPVENPDRKIITLSHWNGRCNSPESKQFKMKTPCSSFHLAKYLYLPFLMTILHQGSGSCLKPTCHYINSKKYLLLKHPECTKPIYIHKRTNRAKKIGCKVISFPWKTHPRNADIFLHQFFSATHKPGMRVYLLRNE